MQGVRIGSGLVAYTACVLASSSAFAQVYTDEASFLAQLGGMHTTITFDNFAHGTIIDNLPGVDFDQSGFVYDEFHAPSGGAWHTIPNVLLNNYQRPTLHITFVFDPPVDGVGFYNTSIADREQVELFDISGQQLIIGGLPQGSVNFFGFVSQTPIASGDVVGIPPTNGTIFIDTFSFGFRTPPCPGDRGDANCDGTLDFFDIDPFLTALFDPISYAASFCGGSVCAADTDCSGGVDFFDIDPLLTCLFNTCPPCP